MSASTIPPASAHSLSFPLKASVIAKGDVASTRSKAPNSEFGRRGNGLHDHAAARRLPHSLDDRACSREGGFNEAVRSLARSGRPGEAEDAAIGGEHDEVGLRRVDGARLIEGFLNDGIVAAQNHVDQDAMTHARTLDRRGEERQGPVADERDLDWRELGRLAGQGLRDACQFRELVLVQPVRGEPEEFETGLGAPARLLERGDPSPKVGRRISQPRKIGHHGMSLTPFDLSWKRWRRQARQRCASARSRRWRT